MGNSCCVLYDQNERGEVEEARYCPVGETDAFSKTLNDDSEDSSTSEDEFSTELVTDQPQSMDKKIRVRALYPFRRIDNSCLSFEKGDIFYVNNKRLDAWVEAINARTHERGYIPGKYVRLDNDLPTGHDAFYNIDRLGAEQKLFLPGQKIGTYIIRPRGNTNGTNYALSLLVGNRKNLYPVQHYKIHVSKDGEEYYLSPSARFASIKNLIQYYTTEQDILPCPLTEPCPRIYQPPVQFRDLEVNRSSILMREKIGSGEFGEVYRGIWNCQLTVAIKQRLSTMDRDTFLEEARVMHQLHHERLVQLLGVCTEPANEPVLIITEFMPKGSLYCFLRSEEGKTVTIKDQVLMMTQIAEGMKYLESKGYLHRDLRAANVLVDRDNSVKVADFGLARLLQNASEYRSTSRFPIKWTAPEAAFPPHRFSLKSDVWSFGVVMYEIIKPNHEIYEGMRTQDVALKVKEGYRMPNPLPDNRDVTKLYEWIKKCWSEEPQDRPTFRKLHNAFCSWTFGPTT